MRIDFQTKNYNASENLKDVIAKKLERLEKFFETPVTIKVMMKESKKVETMELTVYLGKNVIRAEISGKPDDTMYNLIDLVLPKLEKQIVKAQKIFQSKSKKTRQKALVDPVKTDDDDIKSIVRKKSYNLEPMSEDEAMEELELVGHNFFVFLNRASNIVNVIYKRFDGDYGIIEALV